MVMLSALTSRFGRLAVCHTRQLGASTVQQASRQIIAGPSRITPVTSRQFSSSSIAQATMNQGKRYGTARGELEP